MLLRKWNEFQKDDAIKIANNIASTPTIIVMIVKVTTFNCKYRFCISNYYDTYFSDTFLCLTTLSSL